MLVLDLIRSAGQIILFSFTVVLFLKIEKSGSNILLLKNNPTIKTRFMKKSIIALLLLLSSISYAQNNNFVVEDSLIIWRKVYEMDKNFSEIKNNPRLEFKTDSSGCIKKKLILVMTV